MIKILFVCLGNICRSPTAEGVFRHKLNQVGIRDGYLENIYIDSAGTGAYHTGHAPDIRAQQTAQNYGVDLSKLKARQITRQDFNDYDYILAMDRDNISNMKRMCPKDQQQKIKLFLEYSKNYPTISEVPDPYTGEREDFEYVYNIIDQGSSDLLEYFLNHYALSQ
ncbi:MAG: low molecular weight phosphotyrosine protein phosphatase [Emcibacter sp.]|nr:low molecular weight phosphotyrosine protein phosphatase [Emcibacter sp.]